MSRVLLLRNCYSNREDTGQRFEILLICSRLTPYFRLFTSSQLFLIWALKLNSPTNKIYTLNQREVWTCIQMKIGTNLYCCLSVKSFKGDSCLKTLIYFPFPHQIVSQGVCIGCQLGNRTNLGFWWSYRTFAHGGSGWEAAPRGFHLILKRLKAVSAFWCCASIKSTDGCIQLMCEVPVRLNYWHLRGSAARNLFLRLGRRLRKRIIAFLLFLLYLKKVVAAGVCMSCLFSLVYHCRLLEMTS